MSHAITGVKLYNPRDESRSIELELLVDTSSTYAWIKRGRLVALGIEPTDRRFRTIDNRVIERDIGEAVVECLARRLQP